MEYIKIETDGDYFYAVMPDGKRIPAQLNTTISSPVDKRGIAIVTIECEAIIKDLFK